MTGFRKHRERAAPPYEVTESPAHDHDGSPLPSTPAATPTAESAKRPRLQPDRGSSQVPRLSLDDVTALIVNFKTREHTRTCLDTLRAAYPALAILAVNNGSGNDSTKYLRQRAISDTKTTVLFNERNIFHGPTLHQGMCAAETRFVLLLHSNCEVRHGGLFEPLLDAFDHDRNRQASIDQSLREWPVDRRQSHTICPPIRRRIWPPKMLQAPAFRSSWGAARPEHVGDSALVSISAHAYRRPGSSSWQRGGLNPAMATIV